MAKPYLSVIIPAYNEAERLPKTLLDIDKTLSTKGYPYEIIVVSGGSSDNTAGVTRKMAAMIKGLKLIESPENKGKGGAVRLGMLAAEGEIRLFMDADNATTVDHFEQMRQYFPEGYGVVICSRSAKGSKLDPPEPWYRQLPGKMGNLFWIQPLVLPGLWDTQCGFKAFTAEATEKLFDLTKLSGWSFDVEVLALAKALGYRIREVPVLWHHDTESKVKASSYIQVLLDVLKIRWWLWTDAYGLKELKN